MPCISRAVICALCCTVLQCIQGRYYVLLISPFSLEKPTDFSLNVHNTKTNIKRLSGKRQTYRKCIGLQLQKKSEWWICLRFSLAGPMLLPFLSLVPMTTVSNPGAGFQTNLSIQVVLHVNMHVFVFCLLFDQRMATTKNRISVDYLQIFCFFLYQIQASCWKCHFNC